MVGKLIGCWAVSLGVALAVGLGDAQAQETAANSTTDEQATATAQPTTADAQPASSQAAQVLPGPLFSERKSLLDHIDQAGRHGIGTANYKMAFKSIEDQVAAGATETQIKPRVQQLTDALKEQLVRAQNLKYQRPLPPTASQQADASPPTAAGQPAVLAGGGLGSLGNSGIIEKLKDKLGTGGLPSADVVEKLLQSYKAKDLLKKLGQ